MDVALVGQQMLGLAEIVRRGQRGLEMLAGLGGSAGAQRGAAQRQVRAHVLAERPAFAAFPGLEVAAADERERFGVLAGLVVEGAQLDAQIVALADEVELLFQLAQALRGFLAEPLPELVALEEQPGVGGIRRGRPCRRQRGPWRACGGC